MYFVSPWHFCGLRSFAGAPREGKTVPKLKTHPLENAACSLIGCHEYWNADGLQDVGPREFA